MAVLELDPLPGPTGPPPKTYLELDPIPAPKNYLELDPETAPPMASIFGDPSIPAMPLSSMAAGATAEPAPAPPGLSLSAVLAAPPPPVVPGPDVALHQLQQPTPPPAAPEFTDPMSGSPMTLMDPPGTGFAGGLAAGHKEMVRQGMRTLQGEAFTPDPNAPEPPKDPGFGYELGHGLAYSTPTLAAGLAGGAAGGAIGSAVPVVGTGLGALVGSALGVALTSAAQDLAPTYAAAIQRGMTHEDAVDYAWKHAAATGTLSGLASAIPGGKTILGRILFQGFVAQPAGGAAVRAGVPAVMGEPLPSAGEFARGYGQDVIMGLGFGAGHAGAREVIQAVRPPPEPVVPATSPIDIIARERLAPPQPDQPVSVPEAPVVEPPAPAPPTPGMTATMPEQPGVPAAAPVLPAPVPGQRVAPRLPEVPAAEPSAPVPGERQEPPPIRTEPESAPPVAPPTEARAEAPAVEAPAVARPAEGAPLPLEPAPARAATEPEPRAPVEPVPPSPQAEPSVPPTEPRVTTEPDHLDPTRYVAKNEAGEVIGKGATAEEATADAQARGGQVYPAEPAAAEATPVTTLHPREDYRTVVGGTYSLSPRDKATLATAVERAVAERGAVTFKDLPREITDKLATDQLAGLKAHLGNPDLVLDVLRGDTSRVAPARETPAAAAAAPEAPAKRPVSSDERKALEKAADGAYKAFRNAESRKGPQDPATLAAQDKYRQAQAALEATEGPPSRERGYYQPGQGPDANLTREQLKARIKERDEAHEASVAAHNARVDERVHAEGTDPTPEPAKASQVFSGRDVEILRGPDSQGNTWTGNGNVMVKGQTLTRAYNQASGRKTTTVRDPPAPEGMSKVTTPDPKADYQPIVWDRQVTNPHTGEPVVVGTKADGSRVTIAKPVYDVLHAAAGTDGTLVQAKSTGGLHDPSNRVFARNAKGETTGVAMPIALDQARAGIWARGAERLQEQKTGAKVAGEPRLEDRGLVPGPAEAPGTSGPRTGMGNKSEVISHPPYPERPSSQLQNLTATRDALEAKPNKTATDRTRLDRLNTQVERLTTAEERRAGRNQPVSGAPRPRSQDFLDYKFNNGVSVYRSVFEQAGHDPDLATSRPVAWQNEVLQRHMMSTFGFKDVSLAKGTPVDDYVRREAMLDSTRAIQDLMGTLGLPNEAASLNGRLTLVYDPEGKVNYFGRYSLTEGEIRLAGRANSFGHEWTHAVDHLLAERATGNQGLTNDLLTRYARKDQLDPRDGVQGAFARVLNALYYDKAAQALREMHLMAESRKVDAQGNPTKGALVAQRQLDALERGNLRLRIQPSEFRAAAGTQGNRAYFQDPAELLARAHESYLARQMKNQGLDPRGAVMPDEAYLNESERLLKALYPKPEDQGRIFDSFKVLHDEMRNADVLSQGKPGAAFPNLGISDPRHYPPSLLRQPGAQSTKQEHARWTARVNRLLNDQLFERDRPQGPLGWGTRVADLGRGMTWSDGGLMQVQIDRAPAGVRPFLQELRDLVTTDPGSGRYNPEFLEERSRFVATDFMRRFTRIIQNGGYDHPTKMPAEDNLMLRHILTTGDDKAFPPDPTKPNQTKPIPDHIKQIAGNLRGLLNEAWQMAHNAGIDVGYAKSGYFPRQYDKQLVYSNPDGFRTAAGKVYGVMFDQELGAPGSDPQALFEKWSGLSKAYKAGADPDLAPMMRELNKNLREQRGIEENPKPTPADQARLAQLKAEATQLAGDAHPLLRDHISGKEAESFWQRMANPDIHNFDSEGFSARHFSGRTLPPEADTIMRDFMVTSVNDAIPHYFESVARRVADAERFGPKGERAEALLQKALDAGLHPEELQKFKTSLNRVRGVNQPGREAAYSTVSNLAHAYGGVVLMDRSAWSSLSEPINAGLVTGYHSLGPRIIANQFAQGFGQLFRRASARERAETAELLGVINSAQTDAIIASRMGRDYADTPRIAKFMQGFYRLTGLTQLTNSQRIANVAGAHWFLTKLAKSYTNQADGFGARFGKEKAERWFSELGVPEELHGDFAKWVQDQQGQVPTSAKLLADDMAPVYGLAVRRITNRVIQNPFKVDRAAHADMPGVGLAFQLMSFNYAYQKNVLEPAFKSVHTAYHFGKEDALNQGFSSAAARARGLTTAAGTTANMAAAAGAVVAVGFLTTAMREAVFSPDKWEEHDEKGDTGSWLANLAMQRSGLNGTLDPLIQVVTNLKYFTDVQSLLGGGSVAWVGKNMTDLVMGVFGEKGETNARLYQGWRGALNLGGVPLAAFILNAVGSVNPVMRLAAGAALQLGTSSEMVSRITAAIAGPKGAKPAEADGGKLGGLGDLKGLEGMGGLDAETKKTGGGEGGGGLIPWALLDDFISPATRVAAPLLNVIPGPLKALGATAGVGAGLLSAYNAGSPYRGQPAPEKRAH